MLELSSGWKETLIEFESAKWKIKNRVRICCRRLSEDKCNRTKRYSNFHGYQLEPHTPSRRGRCPLPNKHRETKGQTQSSLLILEAAITSWRARSCVNTLLQIRYPYIMLKPEAESTAS